MDAKSIKSHLKEAKEAIKNKDIEKALKLCKAVLKADRGNYLAFVIFGAALQESENKNDAVNAFKKAIEISPQQILAWQGLASYYEKEGVEKYHQELIPVYKELFLLETDSKKQKDIVEKLNDILKNHQCLDLIIEVLQPCLEYEANSRIFIADLLCKYFSTLKEVPEKYSSCFKQCLQLKIETGEPLDGLSSNYCLLLYKSSDFSRLIEYCRDILSKNEDNIDALEWICRIYFENNVNLISVDVPSNIQPYVDKLSKLKENSIPGLLVEAARSFEKNDFVNCRAILNDVIEIDARNPYALYFLSKVNFSLNAFEDVVQNVSLADKYLPKETNDELRQNLRLWRMIALTNSSNVKKCEEGVELCNELLESDPSNSTVLKCLIRGYIELQKWDSVESNLNRLDAKTPSSIYLKSLYNFKLDKLDEAVKILTEDIQENVDHVEHFLLLGKLYRVQEKHKEALSCFLKAAKLAPHIYSSFLELGHYYRDVNNDLEKARRCYQKAFQLNPKCEETGVSLSDVYRRLNNTGSNYELLSSVTSAGSANWVWLRLGLHYLDVNNLRSAVDSLRTAVRLNPNDSRCWECLGDAYYTRGSYISALKCYEKCLELNSSSIYATLQIAFVKQKISLHDESIREFRALIEQNPDYIPALDGLAQVCLSEARSLFNRQIVGSARDLCEEAATCLTKILKQNGKLASVWKLFADVCLLVCRLPEKISFMNLSAALLEQNQGNLNTDESICVRRDQLLNFTLKCYFVAVKLNPADSNGLSFLWHDIAICYTFLAKNSQTNDKSQFMKFALIASKKSVSLMPQVWDHWNLLGVIACSKEINDPKLAQHCFIKSIQIDNDCAVSWTNLGVLYLQLEDIQLANEAFQNAQRSDPKYSRSWIGQALIAESVDHLETIDLFYHTTQLGYHDESAKGFAEWICKVLKEWDTYRNNHHCYYIVERMAGLQVAATVLHWYTVHNPNDASASNMLGVLLELCNLPTSAVAASKNSLQCVADEKDIVRSNLGRQLRKIKKYQDSIEIYREIKQTDFATQCDLALSLFSAHQYDEALASYESAIHWFAPDEGSMAQVMVATAALNYMQKKTDVAQTILFQCIGLKPVPVYGLFAACAFGMLNNELKLSKLVLRELEAFKNESEYTSHIAIFKSYCEVIQQNFKVAIRTMSKFIYNRPGDASLWFSLCILLLRLIYEYEKDYIGLSISSAYHARCAISLGRGVIDISGIYSIMSLSHLLAGKGEESLRSSMKAVHMYPEVAENWAVLIVVLYSRGNDYPSLLKMISHVKFKLNCSKTLNAWLSNIERKVTKILG
ncbi:tetratricopeptide repeat protein 37 [Planococcus citri]|uniref:tetratricopeptide repeat protein 37 n=1 Tax=Planococcus citri TaxID=170843 RepID=UPI0031F7B780